MLCKSVSQALFRILLLFMACAVPLLAADYENDTLSSGDIAAIKRTYTLEQQLRQQSQIEPATAAANQQKIAALAQARAELSRVYSTPLFTTSYDASSSTEANWISSARGALARAIPEDIEKLDLTNLRVATTTFVASKKQAEAARLQWFERKKAELVTLQEDINKAEKILRDTGNATEFLAAQKQRQKKMQEYGPLRSVSGLDTSAELEQANLERATHARAVKIIEETIAAKAAASTEGEMLDWRTRYAVATQQLKNQEAVVTALRTKVQATTQEFAELAKAQKAADATAALLDARSREVVLPSDESEDDVIARHKQRLEEKKEYYRALVDQAPALTEQKRKLSLELQTINTQLQEAQDAADELERAARKENDALVSRGQKPAEIKPGQFFSPDQDLLSRRDGVAQEIGRLQQQLNAKKELIQVQRDVEEFDAKLKAAETAGDATAATAEEKAAAKVAARKELYRDLVARDLFEKQMEEQERKRLEGIAANDARRATAQRFFDDIDSNGDFSSGSSVFSASPTTPDASLRTAFNRLTSQQQIELTKYLENPSSEFEAKDANNPIKKLLDAARNYDKPTARMATSEGEAVEGGGEGKPRRAPRNLFKQMYFQDWDARYAEIQAQLYSPLTRAKWYKDNPQLFTQLRQQVDTTTARADEEAAGKDRTTMEQQAKAADKNRDALRIKRADEEELEATRETGEEQKLTPEQARQRRILTKAPAYYAAIAETIEQLRTSLNAELQRAQANANVIASRGEEVPDNLLRQIAATERKASDILDAFKADPTAFLTQHRTLDTISVERGSFDGSAPLAIFRRALADNGIEFWRDEDVAPEITNALNLLKNPESADGRVKEIVGRLPQSLSEAVETDRKITQALSKLQTKVVGAYDSPVTNDSTRDRIKSASQLAAEALARKAAGAAISAEMASKLTEANQAKNMNAANKTAADRAQARAARIDDAAAASGRAEGVKPVAHLSLVINANGELVENSSGTFLMTSEEATKAARDSDGVDIVTIDLDLTNMDEAQLKIRLKEALRGKIADENIDDVADDVLPTEDPAARAQELRKLQGVREYLIPLEQERMRAARELEAARIDPVFKDLRVRIDDTTADEDGTDEDTDVRKLIKRFDAVKAEYERIRKIAAENPDDPDAQTDAEYQKRETHAFLVSLVNSSKQHLELQDEPLTKENRTLLLALQDEAFRVLKRPEMKTLNDEADLDPQDELTTLVATHRETVAEEDTREQKALEALKTNPTAALKQAQIEAARLAYEAKLAEIRKMLIPAFGSTEITADQAARARTARQEAQDEFDAEVFELKKQMQADLDTEPEDRIKRLDDELAALRRTVKGLTPGSSEQQEAQARLQKLQGLRTEEERVRPLDEAKRREMKAAKAEASTARTSRLTKALTDSGSVSASDAASTAREMVGARSNLKAQHKRSARPTSSASGRSTPRPTRGH